MRSLRCPVLAATVLFVVAADPAAAAAMSRPGPSRVTPVAVALDGGVPDRGSNDVAMSADGRYVAFQSAATNLVPGDTNGRSDIFVRDSVLGTTVRVSVSSRGDQGDAESRYPAISADGRFVVFDSSATTLVPRDTNDSYDIFRHDLRTGRTIRVSVAADGGQAAQGAIDPDVSADGRQVVFTSSSPDLVPGDSTRNGPDVFLKDLRTGAVEIVSLTAEGRPSYFGQDPVISADGNRVVFTAGGNVLPAPQAPSNADTILYLRDRARGTTSSVSGELSDPRFILVSSTRPQISADGRYVVFTFIRWFGIGVEAVGHTYRKDTVNGDLRLISADSTGRAGMTLGLTSQDISADGRYVVFSTQNDVVPGDTDGLPDVHIADVWSGRTRRITQGTGLLGGGSVSISDDGRRIAFEAEGAAAVYRLDPL